MPEASQKQNHQAGADLGLSGFETLFEELATADTQSNVSQAGDNVNVSGESYINLQVSKLIDKLTELISLNVDQRVETARIANQLIENQRQLVATQQILIRLMDRSIELTRHIATIEEKLPAVFELPSLVESLRDRVARMEAVEFD